MNVHEESYCIFHDVCIDSNIGISVMSNFRSKFYDVMGKLSDMKTGLVLKILPGRCTLQMSE